MGVLVITSHHLPLLEQSSCSRYFNESGSSSRTALETRDRFLRSSMPLCWYCPTVYFHSSSASIANLGFACEVAHISRSLWSSFNPSGSVVVSFALAAVRIRRTALKQCDHNSCCLRES